LGEDFSENIVSGIVQLRNIGYQFYPYKRVSRRIPLQMQKINKIIEDLKNQDVIEEFLDVNYS